MPLNVQMSNLWKMNTSNAGKLEEYKQLFAKHGFDLSASTMDIREIDADPLLVVVHKASQMNEMVLIDDTALHIEGEEIGIHIRWLLSHLANYIGKSAEWIVFLAYRKENKVHIYQGMVKGKIVPPQGEGGFGFDAMFLPNGSEKTLAQGKPDEINARAMAVQALIKNEPIAILPTMNQWEGAWQP
ncbi:MAG: non-canonical purine NTP pyrophosphatase [Chlamydiales bacterium]